MASRNTFHLMLLFLYLFSLCTVRGHMTLSIIKRVTVNYALNDFHVKCHQSFNDKVFTPP